MTAGEKVIDGLVLKSGAHGSFEEGACLLEAVSYVAGEPWSDHPSCVSPVLGAYGRSLNDRLDDESRQLLKPFIPRLLNSADDGQDDARRWMAADWAIRVGTPRWLDAAGLTEHAEKLRALPPIVDAATHYAARSVAREARDEAYALRTKTRAALVDQVKAELVKTGWKVGEPFPAVAAAAAAAAAVAAAVAAAAAAAVAVADAAAVAVAAAAAAADADADADAAAARGTARWYEVYDAVYKEVRAQLRKKTSAEILGSKYADVAAINQAEGIELLGRMIDPKSVNS